MRTSTGSKLLSGYAIELANPVDECRRQCLSASKQRTPSAAPPPRASSPREASPAWHKQQVGADQTVGRPLKAGSLRTSRRRSFVGTEWIQSELDSTPLSTVRLAIPSDAYGRAAVR